MTDQEIIEKVKAHQASGRPDISTAHTGVVNINYGAFVVSTKPPAEKKLIAEIENYDQLSRVLNAVLKPNEAALHLTKCRELQGDLHHTTFYLITPH